MNALTKHQKVLRRYQVEAINLLRQSFGSGYKRTVIQLPTGAGKTVIASTIAAAAVAKGNQLIFTAPAIVLIDQTIRAFEDENIFDIGAMQAKHPRTNPMAKVQIASVQTLANREIPEASMIIVDECHLGFKVIEDLMDERPDVFFVGLSATPWAKGMGLRWQNLIIPVTIHDLIGQGFLSEFRAYAPSVPDLSKVKKVAGDFHEGQLEEIMKEKKLVGDVVSTWLAKGENRPTLCFGVNRAHANEMWSAFEAHGIAAAYCDAYTDSAEMRFIEERFRSGEIKIVCSVRKITTGVDWPVGCIIDAAPTMSEMLHVQKIGRGLRVNPGTEDLIILDHASNSLRLGLVTDISHTELDITPKGERQKKTVSEKLPKPCSQCGVLFTGVICPSCGHEKKPVADVDVENGELQQIGGKKDKWTIEDKRRFWGMARRLDRERRKGGKLAKALYRSRFGVWPKSVDGPEIVPDQAFMNYEKSRRIAYAKRMQKKLK